ncbi:DUF421 domain-containing protein [Brevibacillus formosus]|uniref:Membrane protein n=1 Tax=Brevibacillus formosus TaxID=54913 RepID=A0A837KJD5_9BACL|nr:MULTISPECIES: DUF421 domain-containing protein [Brevibacillus]KLH97202.1 membrane protein [Brevibacillus formosus]MBG9944343.1 membrane protein [Brevibacillus formosus]MBW5468430.1 DUF421 domain-containing protein [Brevibacillus formosus]MED1946216.1 DUF421 domain-containing protein [Brevibacillus formosus]MED1957720.1 DUF421 domain-containing protein [Brevibacillus formosus]
MDNLTMVLLRTLFSYFFLLILVRLMGKRELGKLSVFDVVISIMLAEMAALAIEDVDKPALRFYLPMLLIALLEVVFAYVSLKSKKFRDTVDGSADLIIENGQIREHAMRRNRLNMDDLMVHLRQKDVKNIADVEFALLEPTGQMSVFLKEQKDKVTREDLSLMKKQQVGPVSYRGLPIPLILDGKVRTEALNKIGQNELWLKREIRKYGIKDIREVSFCSVDERGIMYLDKKDKPLQ